MNQDILGALMEHLRQGYTAAPIAWPSVDYTPPAGRYIAVSLFSVPAAGETIASHDRRSGIMQISVMEPLGLGVIGATQEADDIAALFARNTQIAGTSVLVRIMEPPTIGGPLVEKARVQIPVSVRWTSFTET